MAATILIIETDQDSAHLANYLLRSSGYETMLASTSAGGVDAALDSKADLILCGIDMPDLDGFGVVDRLMSSSRWRRVPVVALLRLLKPGDHERIKTSGFIGHLFKPLEPEVFVAQLEKFLPPLLRRSRLILSM